MGSLSATIAVAWTWIQESHPDVSMCLIWQERKNGYENMQEKDNFMKYFKNIIKILEVNVFYNVCF